MNVPASYTPRLGLERLPVRARQRAKQLLASGASFEETLAELHQRGSKGVSLEGLQEFFRHDAALQRRRVARRRRAVEELKRALGCPASPHYGLAEAALETGLAELLRPTGEADAAGRNRELRQQTLYLKHQRSSLAQRVAETERQVEATRWELAQLKLERLQRLLEQERRRGGVTPPPSTTVGEIRELLDGPAACLPHLAAGSREEGGETEAKDNLRDGE